MPIRGRYSPFNLIAFNKRLDHGLLLGLGDDDHTQYALLAGRSGGQILIGGTDSGDNLVLQSTSNATRGLVQFGSAGSSFFDEVTGKWGFGTTTLSDRVNIIGSLLIRESDDGQNAVRLVGDAQDGAISVYTNGVITSLLRGGAGESSYFTNGNVGFGVTDPDTLVELFKNDIQLKLSNDATNFVTFKTETDGDFTLASNKASYVFDLGDGNILTSESITAEQLTSTDDITMQGHLLSLGDNTDTLICIDFLGLTDDGTLTYAPATNSFVFGDSAIGTTSNITALGTIQGGTITDGTAILTGGNLTNVGSITASGDIFTLGDITCDELTLTNATQDFLFTSRGGGLAIQGQADGNATVEWYNNKDGTGAGNTLFNMFTLGIPTDIANRQIFQIGSTTTEGRVATSAAGSGTVLPIKIFTQGRTNQINVQIDGDVSFEAGHLIIPVDNRFIKIGATDTDLQIGSNGTDGIITATGDLKVTAGTLDVTGAITSSTTVTGEQLTSLDDIDMAGVLTDTLTAADADGIILDGTTDFTGQSNFRNISIDRDFNWGTSTSWNGFGIEGQIRHRSSGAVMPDDNIDWTFYRGAILNQGTLKKDGFDSAKRVRLIPGHLSINDDGTYDTISTNLMRVKHYGCFIDLDLDHTYTDTGGNDPGMNQETQGLRIQIDDNPTIGTGSPTLSSTVDGICLVLNASTAGTSNLKAINVDTVAGADTNWAYYNNTAVNNLLNSSDGISYFRDTAIGIYSQADTFLDLFADGGVRVGNSGGGAPTTYLNIDNNGDTYWVGAGTGLPGGSFWGNDIAFVTAGGTGTFTEISDANITVGQTNLATFQNNKEIALVKAGIYNVFWSMSVKATGANKHIVGGIGVDVPGGADELVIQDDGRNHAVSTGNAEFPLSGVAKLDLSASSEVGLMVTNETDNTNITIEHVNLLVEMSGGT